MCKLSIYVHTQSESSFALKQGEPMKGVNWLLVTDEPVEFEK